jgi:HAD superfamily hydrolase (TIGR01509 family)
LFDTVIFDWDGTLANTREVILLSFHQALKEVAGIDESNEFIERRIGVGASETFKEILKSKGLEVNSELIKLLVKTKTRVQVEKASEVRLFPGAKPLLESLNGKVKIGLASMNGREVINRLIRDLDVSRFFEIVLTVDDVSKSKPDPEIFLKTAFALGSTPEYCVVIEDSIFGVKAAKTAGMGCVAVAQGAYTETELEVAYPDLTVPTLCEKQAILKLILG